MVKTNTGLIAYAKGQLGRPYWYGTFGQVSTRALYNQKKKQYPDNYPPKKWTEQSFMDQLNVKVHDCVGLIKGYCMGSGDPDVATPYDSKFDVSANGLFNLCQTSGPIGSIPEIPGLIVWKNNHVGVYVGGGYVIEAQGHAFGVKKNKLSDRPFTHWGKLPSSWITYEVKPAPTPSFKTYQVKITASQLNYRNGPGLQYKINGVIKDKGGIYTIVDESVDNRGVTWGKLKSGVGWISLKYTKRL